MYSYLGLWIRIIWVVIIGLVGFIVLFFFRNRLGNLEKTIFCLMIVGLLLYGGISNTYSLINPKVENVKGIFQTVVRRNGINPFEYEYCFEDENKKVYYLDMDLFSKKHIFPDEFVKGKMYSIDYEVSQNLIVRIDKIN